MLQRQPLLSPRHSTAAGSPPSCSPRRTPSSPADPPPRPSAVAASEFGSGPPSRAHAPVRHSRVRPLQQLLLLLLPHCSTAPPSPPLRASRRALRTRADPPPRPSAITASELGSWAHPCSCVLHHSMCRQVQQLQPPLPSLLLPMTPAQLSATSSTRASPAPPRILAPSSQPCLARAVPSRAPQQKALCSQSFWFGAPSRARESMLVCMLPVAFRAALPFPLPIIAASNPRPSGMFHSR